MLRRTSILLGVSGETRLLPLQQAKADESAKAPEIKQLTKVGQRERKRTAINNEVRIEEQPRQSAPVLIASLRAVVNVLILIVLIRWPHAIAAVVKATAAVAVRVAVSAVAIAIVVAIVARFKVASCPASDS